MNKKKESNDHIDRMLQNIERVEAPLFLFTKIQASIRQGVEEFVPVKYVWAGAFSFMLLLMLNVWTIQETRIETKDGIAIMVEEMDLIPNNSFY